MGTILEVTATKPTRAALQSSGSLKQVRFVSKPSADRAVRRIVVARLSDFEEQPEEIRKFATRGTSFTAPLVLMALGKNPSSVSGLQLLALLSSRFGSRKDDPYVSPSVDVVRRILTAHAAEAARHLIASATVTDGVLSVWSCEPKLYQAAASEIPALTDLEPKDLANLSVSASGSRIHWAAGDIDLDMDAIREFVDPSERKAAESKYRADAVQYGVAIRKVREHSGLRQTNIPGISEREVRRLENGEVLPHSDTLKKLADAHGWSIAEYMTKLASESKKSPARRRR